MDALSTAITSLMGLVTDMLTAITNNTLLCVIFASGFIGIALGVLRKVVRTSKAV